jgi:hypothetical protein
MATETKDTKPVDKDAAEKAEMEARIKEWESEVAMGPLTGGPVVMSAAAEVVYEIFTGPGGFLAVNTERGEVKALRGDFILIVKDEEGKLHFGVLIPEIVNALLGLIAPPPADAYMTNKQWADWLVVKAKVEDKPKPTPTQTKTPPTTK